jgi:CRP/FNR family transcriptional regulator, anaerobic regulatory protein
MSAIAHHSRLTVRTSDGDRIGAVRRRSPAGRCGTGPVASSTVLTVVLEPGECLYHAGEQPDAGYVVKTGLLRQVMLLADGRRQIMRFVFPNDILDRAEAATMPFSAEAVEHAEVRCFSKAQLEGVLSRNATARDNWKRLAEQHFHEMQRHSVVLGRLSSIERLAYFLIWLRQHADDPVDGVIHLPMARGDIADYLGLTVETVSRGFTILRDAGLIDLVNSRHIRLKKPDALSKLAGNILTVAEVDETASTGSIDSCYSQAS